VTLYPVGPPDDPAELVFRLHLSHAAGVAIPPSLAHAAVGFDAAGLQLSSVQSLLDPTWTVLPVEFSDAGGSTGQLGLSVFCESCLPATDPLPAGDLAELRFSVTGAPATEIPVQLASSAGQGNLFFYTGVGVYDSLPAEAEVIPLFVESLAETTSRFVRGDANADGGIDISDAIFSLLAMFRGSVQPPCPDSADANDDGKVDLSDPIRTLNWVFRGEGGPPPPPAGSIPLACDLDPTTDTLMCGDYSPCYE
jgi:hypothetical protein